MIFSLVVMTGLEKCCITSAYLQWLCHSGERPVACGPLVLILVIHMFLYHSFHQISYFSVNHFLISCYYWSIFYIKSFHNFSCWSFPAFVDILKHGGIIIQIVYHVFLVPGCLLVQLVISSLRRFEILQIRGDFTPQENQPLGREKTSCLFRPIWRQLFSWWEYTTGLYCRG